MFTISLEELTFVGSDLQRPEGVIADRDGRVWTGDARGHCVRIDPDGTQTSFGDIGGIPNGLCLDAGGNLVVANMGLAEIQVVRPGGEHEVLADVVAGRRLTGANVPRIDREGRIWVSHSTDRVPARARLWEPRPDGAIVVIENGQARIADAGAIFPNGVTLDATEDFLYVAQTSARQIARHRILAGGELGPAEPYGPQLGAREHPDGIAFDENGNLWVTLPFMNAVGVLSPDGGWGIVLEDILADTLGQPTDICFGGEDLTTAYLGSRKGTSIATFRAPVGGMPLFHQRETAEATPGAGL
jgi:gluconolactonase